MAKSSPKPSTQPTDFWRPYPNPQPQPTYVQLQMLCREEVSLLLGHVLGPCAGWRTYLEARFWDSSLMSQFLPGGNPWEAIPREGLHEDPCLRR